VRPDPDFDGEEIKAVINPETDSGRMKRLFDTDDRARALMDALYASL
jgi:hypothetical protein